MQKRAPITEFPVESWHEVMNTNLHSVFYVTQAVTKRMVPRKRGKIISIGSVMSELGRATIIPYTASKGAVKMMTRGLAAELGKHNIQANAIGPGYFTTEIGALSQVTHLWAYEDLEDRRRRRQQLADDPRWQAFLPKLSENIAQAENKILLPTDFSPLR